MKCFFKLGLGCVGLTLFSYHVKPIGFIWVGLFDIITGKDIIKAQNLQCDKIIKKLVSVKSELVDVKHELVEIKTTDIYGIVGGN